MDGTDKPPHSERALVATALWRVLSYYIDASALTWPTGVEGALITKRRPI